MDWCKNHYLLTQATREQLSLMGRRSQQIQELNRINAEPPLYHPLGQPFCGLIYSLNCQYDRPLEQLTLLFETDNKTSYRAIINNAKQHQRGGFHHWHQVNAIAMQQRFITE